MVFESAGEVAARREIAHATEGQPATPAVAAAAATTAATAAAAATTVPTAAAAAAARRGEPGHRRSSDTATGLGYFGWSTAAASAALST